MNLEQAYKSYRDNLLITIFEVETYAEYSLRFQDLNQLLNLYSRATFYLCECLDESSLIVYYLDPISRERATNLFKLSLPIIEEHLRQAVVTQSKQIPKSIIQSSIQAVKVLQSKPKHTLNIHQRYVLHYLEIFLEYLY